jgi:multimeric flavodoxin WrbA
MANGNFMDSRGKKTLLIVWHSRTGAAWQMAQAALGGAHAIVDELGSQELLDIVIKPADETNCDDLLQASGYIFSAPENLAALSGSMKEFFDRNYYGVLDLLNGRPCAIMISAGTDGTAAARQAERICTGWRLRPVAPTLIIKTCAQTAEAIAAPKKIKPDERALCETVGGTLAALLV